MSHHSVLGRSVMANPVTQNIRRTCTWCGVALNSDARNGRPATGPLPGHHVHQVGRFCDQDGDGTIR